MADNRYKDFTEEAIKELTRLDEKRAAIDKKIKERLDKNLSDQTKTHKKLVAQYEAISKKIDKEIEKEKELLRLKKIEVQTEKEAAKAKKALSKETSFVQDILKGNSKYLKEEDTLQGSIAGNIQNQAKSASIYSRLTYEISKTKAKESVDGGTLSEIELDRLNVLEGVTSSFRDQAKALDRATKEESDLLTLAEERKRIEALREDDRKAAADAARQGTEYERLFTDEQYDKILGQISQTENLVKAKERALFLDQKTKDVTDMLPEPIKDAVNFGKSLVTTFKKAGLAMVALTAGIALVALIASEFVSLDSAAEEFRKETGITVSQMKDLETQARQVRGEYAALGVTAKDFYKTVEDTTKVFGDFVGTRLTEETNQALTILNANFGVTQESAAKTLQLFEGMAGVSEKTAAAILLQTKSLAQQEGVAPAGVIQDISDASADINNLFRGNVTELVRQSIEARKLGTSLKNVLNTAEKLLEFETGIEAELEAAAFVGGQFNLTRARGLAFAGKELEATEEILRQVQRAGDFRKQDFFTRQALARAANMEAGEIDKMLTQQEKLNSLKGEEKELVKGLIKDGLDITKINDEDLSTEIAKAAAQKEQQGQLTNLKNQFNAIGASLASGFVPLLQAITPIVTVIAKVFEGIGKTIKFINDNLALAIPFYVALAGYAVQTYGASLANFLIKSKEFVMTKGMAAISGILLAREKLRAVFSTRAAVADIISGAFSSFKAIPFGAIAAGVLAAAAIGKLFTSLTRANNAGDVRGTSGGVVQIATRENQIYNLSDADQFAAAPGLVDFLDNIQSKEKVQLPSLVKTPETDFSLVSSQMDQLKSSFNTFQTATSDLQRNSQGKLLDLVSEFGEREEGNDNIINVQKPDNLSDPINKLNSNILATRNQPIVVSMPEPITETVTDSSRELMAPLRMMIKELKGLRGDMSSGKIAVNMDTTRVTSTISRNVDESTRNNFNLIS